MTASDNVAVGYESLSTAYTASEHVAIGMWALVNLKTGTGNTAVGFSAGSGNETGSYNVFLGFEAGKKETGSNKLYIHNGESSEPLIYGNFETKELRLYTTKLGFYGVAPVARHATIATPAETTAANTKAIKELIEAVKKVGLIE
jgi:hypothetical protein